MLHRLNSISFKVQSLKLSMTKYLACVFFLISSTAFKNKTIPIFGHGFKVKDGKELITIKSEEFKSFTRNVYQNISYEPNQDTIPFEAFALAMRGFMHLKHTQELTDTQFITIIDFSKYCNKKRLWVLDLVHQKVKINEWVAHGKRSGNDYATTFSNRYNSQKSSLGFYVTGGTYWGRNKFSLKLHGLEKSYNSNAFSRGIVIHGANYISTKIVKRNERIGRSFGCPAVSKSSNKKIINTIKGGSCLFIYHPTSYYLSNSKIINTDLYLTIDDLVT